MKCPFCDYPNVIEVCMSPHEFECRGCGRTIYSYQLEYPCEIEKGEIKLKIKKLVDNAVIPIRAHNTDAGLDLYTIENGVIHYGSDAIIKTGVAVAIPNGYVGIVKEKSGRAVKNKLTVGACVIDSGYRGELLIHLFNNSNLPLTYGMGEAIAQLVIVPCWMGQPEEVDDLDETERGDGKFGSTGLEARVNEIDERTKGMVLMGGLTTGGI